MTIIRVKISTAKNQNSTPFTLKHAKAYIHIQQAKYNTIYLLCTQHARSKACSMFSPLVAAETDGVLPLA